MDRSAGNGSVAIGRDHTGEFAQAYNPNEIVFGTTRHTVVIYSDLRLAAAGPDKTIGFYGDDGGPKPTISGSRDGNAALTSLLTALATLGLVTDETTE